MGCRIFSVLVGFDVGVYIEVVINGVPTRLFSFFLFFFKKLIRFSWSLDQGENSSVKSHLNLRGKEQAIS